MRWSSRGLGRHQGRVRGKLIYDDLKNIVSKDVFCSLRPEVEALLILQSCLELPICLKVNCLHTYEMGISVLILTLCLLMIYKIQNAKPARQL